MIYKRSVYNRLFRARAAFYALFILSIQSVRGSVPITICLANKALKQHLPIETTMDVLKQFKALEQVYTALELNCDQEAQIPVHSNKPIAVFCLRDQFFIAGQMVERDQAIERHDNPEAEEQIRIPAFGDDYDMHEYMRMAEYAGATEELKSKFILRGPKSLVQALGPYLLGTQQNKQLDDAYVQFIFPRALAECANSTIKKYWQDYFYDKLYSSEEFKSLRAAKLTKDTLENSVEWLNWKKSFAYQSFAAACDDIERQQFAPAVMLSHLVRNQSCITWNKSHTHLPLLFFYMHAFEHSKSINCLANKTISPADWEALEYYINVQPVGGEITLCMSDLTKVPWQQLQSLRRDTSAGWTRKLCFKMPSSEIAKQLPKEMHDKTLYLHPPIQFKQTSWSLGWFLKFLGVPFVNFMSPALTVNPFIKYLRDFSVYENGMRRAVNVLNPEMCALIKMLLVPEQSILPGVILSVSKPVEKLIVASAQKYLQEPLVSLPSVQGVLEAIRLLNTVTMPQLFGFNTYTFWIGAGLFLCGLCLKRNSESYEDTRNYIVPDGRGGIRLRKSGWIFPEYFFDESKGCQVTIKSIEPA